MSSASISQAHLIERAINTRQIMQNLARSTVTAGDIDQARPSTPATYNTSPIPSQAIAIAQGGDNVCALIDEGYGYEPTLDDFEDAVAIESGMGSVGIDHREKYRVPLIAIGLHHPRPSLHYVSGQAIVDDMDACAREIVLAQECAAYLHSYWGRYASAAFSSALYAPGTCAPAVLADDYVGADWYYDNVQATFDVPEDEDEEVFDLPRSVDFDVISAPSMSTSASSSSELDLLSSLAVSDVRTEQGVLTAPTSLLSGSDLHGASAAHKPRPRGESFSTWVDAPDYMLQMPAVAISASLPAAAVAANPPAVIPPPVRHSHPSTSRTYTIAYHSDAFWDLALGRSRYRGMVDEGFGGSMLPKVPTTGFTSKTVSAGSCWVPQCPDDFFGPSWDEDLFAFVGETQPVATAATGLDVEY